MDNFWLCRRLPVITPNHYKMVRVHIDNRKQIAKVTDPDSEIVFEYGPKKKELVISRVMFTNPKRFPKEYEERKYQCQTRTQLTGIPFKGGITKEKSVNLFTVAVVLEKQYATPENIATMRSVLIDLGKDDYDQHVFVKFIYGDQTLMMDAYHYSLARVMLLSDGKVLGRYSPHHDVEISTIAADRLTELLRRVDDECRFNNLTSSDIIEEREFDQWWNQQGNANA